MAAPAPGQEAARTTADRLHSVAIHLLRHARVTDVATGLSAPRLSVLSVLVYAGPRTVTELAAIEQVTKPTMTRLLQGLESSGHVRRSADAADGRVVRLHATARGRRALEAGRRARLARIGEVLSELSAGELDVLGRSVAALERALAAIRRDAAARTDAAAAPASATRGRRRTSR